MTFNTILFRKAPLFLTLPLLAACSLTSEEVEPSLPTGLVDGFSMVAFYANRLPVVANNYGSLSSLFVIGGLGRAPIELDYLAADRIILDVSDMDNTSPNSDSHSLHLGLNQYQGVGVYAVDSSTTNYYVYGGPGRNGGSFRLQAGAPNQFVVTATDTLNRPLRGTFLLSLVETYTGEVMTITDGRFSLNNH